MTTLLAWLTRHHMPYWITNTQAGPHMHRIMARACAHHHMLAAYAVYHAHVVMYCYHP